MALRTKIKDLFVPRKTQDPVGQPGYGTDMRAIEMWAQQVLAYINANGIVEITSTGGTVTITNPFGPVTNLEASGGGGGGITDITSSAGTISITNPAGPTTNLEVANVPFLPYSDGNDNTGYGNHVFPGLTSGIENTAFGRSAAAGTSGNSNIAVGYFASAGTTGSENVAIGAGAGAGTSGGNNTQIGYNAGQNITTGNDNTAVGAFSGPTGTAITPTTCLGSSTSCTLLANGGVAIGIDHSSNSAQAKNQDDFVLGTANHIMVFSNHSTGGTTTILGTNSPAVSATPAGWIKMRASNASGSTIGWIPFWQ